MDSRFAQKGKIWRDFADDDKEEAESSDTNDDQSGSDQDSDIDQVSDEGISSVEEEQNASANDSQNDINSSEDEESNAPAKKKTTRAVHTGDSSAEESTSVESEDRKKLIVTEGDDAENSGKRIRKKSALRKDAVEYREKLRKRGVVYMSRIPPKMGPDQARTLLQEYGEVARIYFAEEDAAAQKRRAASGGSHSTVRRFVEGWIEFAEKKVAKLVAASLNNTPISIRKGNAYVDERWNLKYLRKFNWDFLTEKLTYERRVREAKLKASMMQAKRSNAEFAEAVEKNKAAKHAQQRIEKKRAAAGAGDNSRVSGGTVDADRSSKKRKFRQTPSLAVTHGENSTLVNSRLLSKVWSQKRGEL